MTTIETLSNQGQAAFLLSVLRGHGFDAVLLDEGSFHYNAIMSSMRLQVPDAQAADALEFLRTTTDSRSSDKSSDANSNDKSPNA